MRTWYACLSKTLVLKSRSKASLKQRACCTLSPVSLRAPARGIARDSILVRALCLSQTICLSPVCTWAAQQLWVGSGSTGAESAGAADPAAGLTVCPGKTNTLEKIDLLIQRNLGVPSTWALPHVRIFERDCTLMS